MPLHVWIAGTTRGNLSAIIKSGVCNDEELLLTAWEDVRSQYAEAMGDTEQKLYLSLFKEINRLTITIEQVNILVRTLSNYYIPEFASELNRILMTKLVFDPNDLETYRKNLSNCLSRCKGFKVLKELKSSQFEAISKKQEGGAKADNKYYQSILITLSQFLRYEVLDTITVYQFCDMVKRLNRHLEQANKEK